MNYKVIIFKCGCRYKWFSGEDRPYKVCPVHRRPTQQYILWCKRCNIKITAKPQAGYRQIYCVKCYPIIQNERSKKWAAEHPNYRKKKEEPTRHEQVEVKSPETQGEKDIRQLNAWYNHMREIFKPVWEGIV